MKNIQKASYITTLKMKIILKWIKPNIKGEIEKFMDSYITPTSNLRGLTTSRGEDCQHLPLSERALCSEAGVELAIW